MCKICTLLVYAGPIHGLSYVFAKKTAPVSEGRAGGYAVTGLPPVFPVLPGLRRPGRL